MQYPFYSQQWCHSTLTNRIIILNTIIMHLCFCRDEPKAALIMTNLGYSWTAVLSAYHLRTEEVLKRIWYEWINSEAIIDSLSKQEDVFIVRASAFAKFKVALNWFHHCREEVHKSFTIVVRRTYDGLSETLRRHINLLLNPAFNRT